MKLLSTSLIAAALAGITAALAPRPFERDIDIYSRAPSGIGVVVHSTAERLHRSAMTCAHEVGLDSLVKYHKSKAKWNAKQARRHRDGTGDESSIPIGFASRQSARGTIDHKHAVDASLDAAERAKDVDWPERTKFHEEDAKKHFERMATRIHDAGHADWSKGAANETIARVDHEVSARLSRQAASLAGHRGKRKLANKFDHYANKNTEKLTSGKLDPGYAHATEAKARRFITYGHE